MMKFAALNFYGSLEQQQQDSICCSNTDGNKNVMSSYVKEPLDNFPLDQYRNDCSHVCSSRLFPSSNKIAPQNAQFVMTSAIVIIKAAATELL